MDLMEKARVEGKQTSRREVAMTSCKHKTFLQSLGTQYRNVTIMLCKKLCDDFFLQRMIFLLLRRLGEYLQIISNQ